MEVLDEKYPYRYVEAGIIELNGEPDYRIQKYNTYTISLYLIVYVLYF